MVNDCSWSHLHLTALTLGDREVKIEGAFLLHDNNIFPIVKEPFCYRALLQSANALNVFFSKVKTPANYNDFAKKFKIYKYTIWLTVTDRYLFCSEHSGISLCIFPSHVVFSKKHARKRIPQRHCHWVTRPRKLKAGLGSQAATWWWEKNKGVNT